ELTYQQAQRIAQVQEAAQYYTEEYWDNIRAKLEANVELVKDVLGEDMSSEDYAKRMVDMIKQKKKYYAEQKDKAKRSKPMTQAQQRDYIMKSIESFMPMGSEERVKRHGIQLEQETSKKQKISVEDVPEEKGDEPMKKTVDIKPPSIANLKIIKLGKNGVYQIVKENGTDKIYISFGAMLKDISRYDLTELYRLVMQRYGTNGPEDEYERLFWGDLKTIVHCLNLESADIYMLTKRRYPLPADVCQAMLDKKLQGDKRDEACYQLLKLIKKQAQNKLP
ncbi:hypothetical protein Tco_1365592, partial [Tanacetum coccineum]